MALKTLQCCGDASSLEQRSAFRAIHTLNENSSASLTTLHLMHWHGAQARGPFTPAAAMVVAVVTPMVLCAKGTEIVKNEKALKLVVL
jgi:hypothetical protein